jgi:preprotein translocase subunit SecA
MSTLLKQYMKLKSRSHMKKLNQIVKKINELEPEIEKLTDEQLKEKTFVFKEMLKNGKKLEDIQIEAFAVVREGAKRTIGLRHYDVQLLGGLVLAEGNIGQIQTGEGKTLIASLPSYLFALEGKGVHVITSNEYLAKRDFELIGQIHEFLGLTVGLNISQMPMHEKQAAYKADITYGTGTEFGFDYLRDHMVFQEQQKVQRGHHFAIIDEIDSILIDEARTPLIIANKSNISAELFQITSMIVKTFKKDEDYEIMMPYRQASLTEKGAKKIEQAFGIQNLYDAEHQLLLHFVNQSLQAHFVLRKDVDYIVKDGKIELVDAFTGRIMEGRSLSHGLHQALEAKEGLKINEENETQASVTIQNYFRMYSTLCGMTGSAVPAHKEFLEIYGLDVIEVPTNRPNIRQDYPDLVYVSLEAKYKKIIEEVKQYHEKGRPVLLGTTSIEQSEKLSKLLTKQGLKHQLLNAKNEEKEARMIAMAGQKGQITIATNMAGRGTDILLGEGVAELGGLHIIGTERHESRRIDMQLRGRAGRQGDPGSSQFIISLEDDLLLQFDEEQLEKYKKKMKVDENGLILSPDPQKFIDTVQQTIEDNHFSSRVHLLKLDDVIDQQRKIVYKKRNDCLTTNELEHVIFENIKSSITHLLDDICREDILIEEWDLDGLKNRLSRIMPFPIETEQMKDMEREELEAFILKSAEEYQEQLTKELENETIQQEVRMILLKTLDQLWIKHMTMMEELKDGIHLRGYGQEDPYRLFTMEGFEWFEQMLRKYQQYTSEHIYSYINSIKQPSEV